MFDGYWWRRNPRSIRLVESLARTHLQSMNQSSKDKKGIGKDLGSTPQNSPKPRENENYILSSWKGLVSRKTAVSLRVMIDEFGMGLVNGFVGLDGKSSSG